jgi:hypothetical protein
VAGISLVSAASVKGPFAIDLPLTGPSGVEDRSGGPNKKYTVVMTFNQNIVSVDSASSTCGRRAEALRNRRRVAFCASRHYSVDRPLRGRC